MGFCPSCGKEVTDENFCPVCGKPLMTPMKSTIEELRTWNSRPTGITILGILEIIIGIFLAIAATVFGAFSGMMSSMMPNVMPGMGANFLSAIGGILAIVFGILAAISFFISWALFSAKRMGRTIVIVFSIIHLGFGVASLSTGNGSGILSMILDAVILYYMWRPHVIAYFNR